MSWKIVRRSLLALLVIVLIYPGIPLGGILETTANASGGYADITCRTLYLNGLHYRHFHMDYKPGEPINVSLAPCYKR